MPDAEDRMPGACAAPTTDGTSGIPLGRSTLGSRIRAIMRTTVNTPDAPAAIGPYSQAVRHGGLLWCSGQLGLDPANGTFAGDSTVVQADQALRNLEAICREAGTSLTNALRLTLYLVDLADFQAVNQIYQRYFESPHPARATVPVAALPKGGRIEIDAVVAI